MGKSLEDIKLIRNRTAPMLKLREELKLYHITMSMGTCGLSNGAREILIKLVDEKEAKDIKNVVITQTGTLDSLEYEPMMKLSDNNGNSYLYVNLTEEKALEILNEHVVKGNVVEKYLKK